MSNSRQTILVIDDDKPILELVSQTLQAGGFEIITAAQPQEGLDVSRKHRVDLIVLDMRMPGMNGLEVCRQLRAEPTTARLPIIILSVDASEADRVAGLDVGADDYMAKPFSPRELLARVRAVLRRAAPSPETARESQPPLRVGPLTIDAAKHEVSLDGAPLVVTAMEFKMIRHLAARAGEVVSREQLLEASNDSDVPVLDRTADVHVASIRRKLKAHGEMIETIRGVGYRLRAAEQHQTPS